MALCSEPCTPTALLEEGMRGSSAVRSGPGCQGQDGALCYRQCRLGGGHWQAPGVAAHRASSHLMPLPSFPAAAAGVSAWRAQENDLFSKCAGPAGIPRRALGVTRSPMSIRQACPPAAATLSCCDLSSPEAQAVPVIRTRADLRTSSPQFHLFIPQPQEWCLTSAWPLNGAAPGKLSLAPCAVGLAGASKAVPGSQARVRWVSPADSAQQCKGARCQPRSQLLVPVLESRMLRELQWMPQGRVPQLHSKLTTKNQL